MKVKKTAAVMAAISIFLAGAAVPGTGTALPVRAEEAGTETESADESGSPSETMTREEIEEALDLRNMRQEWTYSADADAWSLSVVTAVVYPEIEGQQGVSVCVPGAYVTGIDTDGDGAADLTAADAADGGAVQGALVIDHEAEVTSTNGQIYTADTAPVILNTGAAGYSSSSNTTASSSYAAEGYINVSCGNRGKQDSIADEEGNTVYTGDAPCCLVDQKNAARFVKYNMLLGNVPGDPERFVSTGGSGGGAHAIMFAATSDHPDFYPYEAAAGAVGVYRNEDGSFDTTVTIDGEQAVLGDGAWGCMAYSGITSLAEADMAMAFEYYLDPAYTFGTAFQKQTAEYLAAEYMDYINAQELTIDETAVDLDLNGDGAVEGTAALTIEYDPEKYPDTNGYGGSYTDLYLAQITDSLQSYLDRLDYAEDWTWFNADGEALTDEETAALTLEEKQAAFIEGRYAKSSSGRGGMGGPGEMGGFGGPGGEGHPDGMGAPDGAEESSDRSFANSDVAANSSGDTMDVGTPDAGTTQAAGSSTDSANYADFEEMLEAYREDVAEVEEGDAYGNNIVELYDPLNYIGADGTNSPAWVRILMGASEGDISMMNSLNLKIALLNAGIDTVLEWQWDGGHVPSEILGDSFALWVDTMYGAHMDGAAEVTKAEAEPLTANGTQESASGTDLSEWVAYEDLSEVSFTLAAAAAYRTAGASKAIPGFDVMDYGQEDYVFGSSTKDARHWDKYVLKVFEENAETLAPLFNAQ